MTMEGDQIFKKKKILETLKAGHGGFHMPIISTPGK